MHNARFIAAFVLSAFFSFPFAAQQIPALRTSSAALGPAPSSQSTSSASSVNKDAQAISASVSLLQQVFTGAGWMQDWTKNPIKVSATLSSIYDSSAGATQTQIDAEYVGPQKIRTTLTSASGSITSIVNGTDGIFVSGSNSQHVSAEALADVGAIFPFFSALLNPSDPTVTFELLGTETVNGRTAMVISAHKAKPDQTASAAQIHDVIPDARIWIASDTLLPIRTQTPRRAEGVSVSYLSFTRDFSDYRVVSGVAIPFTIQESLDGNIIKTYSISNISLGTAIPDSDFTIQN